MKTEEREMNADDAARDPKGLFREAGEGGQRFVIVNEDGVPAAAVMSMADFNELTDDLELMTALLVRVASGSGKRHTMDDVMARFGYSHADLDAASETCC